MSDHGLISSYLRGPRGAANGQDSCFFLQGCTGLWTAGCWLACRLHQPEASTTMHGPRYFNFLIFVQCVALRNLELLIKTGWSAICPLYC